MKNDEFQRLVDRNLSGLEWDERKRQQVLRAVEKEEKTMKRFSRTIILVAAILCISLTAFAAERMFSARMDAVKLAEKALEDTYGVTVSMQGSFFGRSVEEKQDGSAIVTYSGIDFLHEALGEYTVVVQDGKASASWSHDGEDTQGLFEANAWGAEQLAEMLRLTVEDGDLSSFSQQAKAIAESKQALPMPAATPQPNAATQENAWLSEEEASAARNAAGRTEEDLLLLALEGVATAYELTTEQREQLVFPFGAGLDIDEVHDYMYYHVQNGKTVFTVMLILKQPAEDNSVFSFSEKDGVYWVDVDVNTGVIEDILYDSQLGGNG